MAWTIPMTAVANEIWTAADYNTHVRDNLNETETAKATAATQYFVATAANTLAARTASAASEVSSSGTTTSTTYTATLTSGGTNPAVTVTTGTRALVFIGAMQQNSGANTRTNVSYAVSGASTIAANDAWCLRQDGVAAGQLKRMGCWSMQESLTSGSNTFTMQYKVEASTGTFNDREIIVVPF